jgi:hypothetical protein
MCAAKGHVCFTPNSDRESGFPQTVMSALPPKADMCGAVGDVRFGPKADMSLSAWGRLAHASRAANKRGQTASPYPNFPNLKVRLYLG